MPFNRKRRAGPGPDPHDEDHVRLKAEVSELYRKLGAQADYHHETADASERRDKALEDRLRAEVAALRAEIHSLASRLPADGPAPPAPDGTGAPPRARGTKAARGSGTTAVTGAISSPPPASGTTGGSTMGSGT